MPGPELNQVVKQLRLAQLHTQLLNLFLLQHTIVLVIHPVEVLVQPRFTWKKGGIKACKLASWPLLDSSNACPVFSALFLANVLDRARSDDLHDLLEFLQTAGCYLMCSSSKISK